MSAGDCPVEEHSDAEKGDGVTHVALKIGRGREDQQLKQTEKLVKNIGSVRKKY